jgi:hypothetical protein
VRGRVEIGDLRFRISDCRGQHRFIRKLEN